MPLVKQLGIGNSENVYLKDVPRLDINDILYFLFDVINVVDYFLGLNNFIRSFVAL